MATGAARTVTVQEMAELLGISRNHAFRCVQRGEIPSVRIGRRVLIPAAFIDRLLDLADRARPIVVRQEPVRVAAGQPEGSGGAGKGRPTACRSRRVRVGER